MVPVVSFTNIVAVVSFTNIVPVFSFRNIVAVVSFTKIVAVVSFTNIVHIVCICFIMIFERIKIDHVMFLSSACYIHGYIFYKGICVKPSFSKKSWGKAKVDCEITGGQLISLDSEEKYNKTLEFVNNICKYKEFYLNRNESGRFGALKSDSTHHFFRNACTKSGSLRFSQFSGC